MRRILVGLLLALAAACAHQRELVPAPGAQVVPGQPRSAEETVSGVHIRVDSNAWQGDIVNQVLSPVRVAIDNDSEHPLRIAYGEFTLGGASGFRLAALPPVQVAAVNPVTPVEPTFAYNRFWIAPWHSRFYHYRFGIWPGPFLFNALYYDTYWPMWPRGLPDETIVSRGLPEGVVDPGGHVDGYLYFADQPKGTRLTFLASLVDASTGQTFGMVQIPFLVK